MLFLNNIQRRSNALNKNRRDIYDTNQYRASCTTAMSETEHAYEFLIIFYRVFARRVQKKQNMRCFVGCLGFSENILRLCSRFPLFRHIHKLCPWSQFCSTMNLNETLSNALN